MLSPVDYYIDQMYSQPGPGLLAVDGVTPSNDTIASESYPLCNEFYAVLHVDAAAGEPERQLLRLAGYRRRTGLHQKIRLCSGGTRQCSEQCRLIFQQLTAFCISVTILHMNVETFCKGRLNMDNSSSHVESRWRTQLRNRIIQASSLLEILLSGLVLIGLPLSAVPLI